MIFKIENDDILNARYLFEYLEEFNLNVVSFFEGNINGELYVNDKKEPTTALLFTLCRSFYLVGDIKNTVFNLELRNFIQKNLLPKYSDILGGSNFRVTCGNNCEDGIDTIFRNLEEEKNCCYTFDSFKLKKWQTIYS